ncbi:NmrA family NAD(P)-binding protein [Dactylosporangium matsuzakiense]|uniref:Nucleoside-diphosphate sugar epimerase n=1 Tax=Dactylosporangium matsuzakiense TaxID=53360 RepID=A0A9W6KBW4_9ACTN|nr:NmrA family NAD(P)-binding protein [Dactylosporangium matsuzakiense]GLK99251.1 nucleoside-diphosphate sugar epimerase [Dactylosporangium matsuzakiense]
MDDVIAVLGATGRVGSRIADRLLTAGRRVRAVSRSGSALQPLAARGADVRVGALDDSRFLTGVLTGARAAFVLTPINLRSPDVNGEQRRNVDAQLAAVRASGVPNVVMLSTWGAELDEGFGGVIGCHWFEEGLRAIDGVHAVFLRPVWFMENFMFGSALIKSAGINGLAIGADVAFPMIAATDIAAAALPYLLEPTFTGHRVRYLNGPRDYTMTEVTRLIGGAIGRPGLRYVRLSDAVLYKGVTSSGALTPSAADGLLGVCRGIDSGAVRAEARSADNTTPTTAEEFIRTTFLPAFHAEPAASLGARLGGLALRSYLTVAGG